ncbi:DUF4840 domain-containing protein [Chryseobacterium geocarposphaerae]|uniref:Uncharacterized protein DUF4840 n=1 Tax=Chryseobacterium geocarposphaerae TaxID=1416776 RepID=A0A2M9C226_9FLAO|nr:DUF4840 domain-containing protein [Chryseobacterium geocarposphaerae]PJJ64447.1 uncharacterized protein DUF4840 [Chryseobacterium geocarposphaerae]
MKKLTVLKSLMIAIIAFLGFSLTSCNDDKYEPIPLTLNDVNGSYRARLVTSQGGKFNEKIIDFTAKDSIITFKDFPVKEIVKSVVKDPAKADAAIASLGKIEYKLNYSSKLNTDQNVVELTFEPKSLTLQIPVDGTIKNTVVKLVTKQKGFFVGYDWSMRFAMEAEKITVDGVELTPYETIKYEVPISIKN